MRNCLVVELIVGEIYNFKKDKKNIENVALVEKVFSLYFLHINIL